MIDPEADPLGRLSALDCGIYMKKIFSFKNFTVKAKTFFAVYIAAAVLIFVFAAIELYQIRTEVNKISKNVTQVAVKDILVDASSAVKIARLRAEGGRAIFSEDFETRRAATNEIEILMRDREVSAGGHSNAMANALLGMIENKDNASKEELRSRWAILDASMNEHSQRLSEKTINDLAKKVSDLNEAIEVEDQILFNLMLAKLIMNCLIMLSIYFFYVRPIVKLRENVNKVHDVQADLQINHVFLDDIAHVNMALMELRELFHQNEIMKSNQADALKNTEDLLKFKTMLISNVSHEIQTPICSISQMLWILQQSSTLTPMEAGCVETMGKSAQHLRELTVQYLDASKIESGILKLERKKFFMEDVIVSAMEIVMPNAKSKGLLLDTSVDEGAPISFIGDETRLKQIIVNFCSNAIKFTDHGFIKLHVSCVSRAGNSAIMKFSVIDTGIGISQENIHKLFRIFSQVDSGSNRKYGGNGLGLYLAQKLAVMMDGSVGVSSILGEGSHFWAQVCLTMAEDTVSTQKYIASDVWAHGNVDPVTVVGGADARIASLCDAKLGQSAHDVFAASPQAKEAFFAILADAQAFRVQAKADWAKHESSFVPLLGEQVAVISNHFVQHNYASAVAAMQRAVGESTAGVAVRQIDKPKVLVVDDTPTNIDVFGVVLGEFCDVLACTSARQGIAIAAESPDIGLIILDLNMPDVDGMEALKRLKSQSATKHIPVVMISASSSPDMQEAAVKAGAIDFLDRMMKPVVMQTRVVTYIEMPRQQMH